MSDYNVVVKVRNGRIISRMRAAGFENVNQLAKMIGTAPEAVGRIVNMKRIPRGKDGDWHKVVWDIAAALRCEPEELFTDSQAASAVATNRAEISISEPEFAALCGHSMGGVDQIEDHLDNKERIRLMLAKLTPREERVVRLRWFDGASTDEIAEQFDVCRAYICQMEAKALRKMKISDRRRMMAAA